ncbi:MAG: DUF6089 family protein [Bacteroidota bacterium]
MKLRLLSLIICLSFALPRAEAQLVMKGIEIGPWVGTSFYLGDLNTNFRLNRPNLAGGFGLRYNFNSRLATKVSFNYGHIEAYDSDSDNPFEQRRNLSFQSDIFEGTLQFEFNFLPYIHGSKEYFFTPYVFGGVTVFNYNPQTRTDDGELVDLRGLGTEGQLRGEEYYILSTALAYGIGFKFDLSYRWSVDMHAGFRNVATDYLDDVSTVYPDRSDLRSIRVEDGPLALELYDRTIFDDGFPPRDREGEQRGDDTNNDRYFFLGVGLNYYFGELQCPDYGNGGRTRRRR